VTPSVAAPGDTNLISRHWRPTQPIWTISQEDNTLLHPVTSLRPPTARSDLRWFGQRCDKTKIRHAAAACMLRGEFPRMYSCLRVHERVRSSARSNCSSCCWLDRTAHQNTVGGGRLHFLVDQRGAFKATFP